MHPYLFPYIGYFQLINSVDEFVIYDNTIPRTTQRVCPNKSCISIKNPALQEAVFVQDPITIKLTYICVNCNTAW